MINVNTVITRLFLALVLAIPMFIAFQTNDAQAKPAAKQTICHIPPGNPANVQEITVSENALPAHLAHGDIEGSCPDECPCDYDLVPPTTTCWDKEFYLTQDYNFGFIGLGLGGGQMVAERGTSALIGIEVSSRLESENCKNGVRCGTCAIVVTSDAGNPPQPGGDCPIDLEVSAQLSLDEVRPCLEAFAQYTRDAIANGVLPE